MTIEIYRNDSLTEFTIQFFTGENANNQHIYEIYLQKKTRRDKLKEIFKK
jgi:hypothetical protein